MYYFAGTHIDVNGCVDERRRYSGDMTSQDVECADWSAIYEAQRNQPIISDIFDLMNFPDETYAMAGNKCRYVPSLHSYNFCKNLVTNKMTFY